MIGYAHAAGFRNGQIRNDIDEIAEYFSVSPDHLARAMEYLETEDRPEIFLLQSLSCEARIGAAVFFSSVWSKAYERVGTPYGRVHRDYHYQCLFSAMAMLVEVGCNRIRIENPMSGRLWRKDAYVCLLEAVESIRKHMNPAINVYLQTGTYDPRMPREVDVGMDVYDLQEHRPIGTHPHIFGGVNMRTVFVEKADVAMRNA